MRGGKELLWLSCFPPKYRTPWSGKCLCVIQSAFVIDRTTLTFFFHSRQEIFSLDWLVKGVFLKEIWKWRHQSDFMKTFKHKKIFNVTSQQENTFMPLKIISNFTPHFGRIVDSSVEIQASTSQKTKSPMEFTRHRLHITSQWATACCLHTPRKIQSDRLMCKKLHITECIQNT
jgi:hypothetical protein